MVAIHGPPKGYPKLPAAHLSKSHLDNNIESQYKTPINGIHHQITRTTAQEYRLIKCIKKQGLDFSKQVSAMLFKDTGCRAGTSHESRPPGLRPIAEHPCSLVCKARPTVSKNSGLAAWCPSSLESCVCVFRCPSGRVAHFLHRGSVAGTEREASDGMP